jgi:cytochrome P450
MWSPAVGILLRVAQRDVNLGPFQIPKGMLVGTNIIGLMHNPKYYKNPEIFNPERWYDKTLYNN